MDINLWTAMKCSVEVGDDDSNFRYLDILGWDFSDSGTKATFKAGDKWDYKKPRCREIIREHFKIYTSPYDGRLDKWRCSYIPDDTVDTEHFYGRTIPDAECKCIEAIYATEDR